MLVSTGAARSEPRAPLDTAAAVVLQRCRRCPGGGERRDVPGVRGYQGQCRYAHHTVRDECIYGGGLTAMWGRAGP